MVKRYGLFIGWIVLLVMAACHEPGKPRQDTSLPPIAASPVLAAIDSLTWQRPDSALVLLQDYFACRDAMLASPDAVGSNLRRIQCVSTNTDYNRHYAHLLLAELLYKNDYAQTNRADLRQVVAYFDSLLVADTRGVSLQWGGRRDARRATAKTVAFLDARAHYINGVGYYENDSVAEACAEYLKALETMQERFEEKELVGHKARFMALTYSHLGELFKEELLLEPSIECFKKALFFCKIEPTSKYGISIFLYNMGIQFDIIGQKDSADFYYKTAIENLPDMHNLPYRDIMTTKTILDYYSGRNLDSVMKSLRLVISLASDENERLTRFLTIGNIFYEDKLYDSARWFLESVFEQQSDVQARMLAAEELRNIYQEEGDATKANQYAAFLANLTMPEYEKKSNVSRLNELFQNYLFQKQEQTAVQEKKEAVLRTVRTFVPIAFVIAAMMIIAIRRKNKKSMAKQEAIAQKEMEKRAKQHEEALEAEKQAHRMEQAALSGRLKRSNERLRDVSKQLEETLAKNTSFEPEAFDDYTAFVNAPVCLYIVRLAHTQQFKSKMGYLIYKESALNKEQLLALRDAAEKHLARFVPYIRRQFPNITDNDMDYCYLFLLGLSEADISALMQRAYTTVCYRSKKISRIIGVNDSLYLSLRNILLNN